MRIVKVVLTGVFIVLYTKAIQLLTGSFEISALNNFILIFLLFVVIVPLSFWSSLKVIEYIKRS